MRNIIPLSSAGPPAALSSIKEPKSFQRYSLINLVNVFVRSFVGSFSGLFSGLLSGGLLFGGFFYSMVFCPLVFCPVFLSGHLSGLLYSFLSCLLSGFLVCLLSSLLSGFLSRKKYLPKSTLANAFS